jgi:pimeloyl-ACP methyl ester carboxylesterase
MSAQQTAKTQYIEANGVKHGYRLFGLTTGVPLVFPQYFRGTMDHWDPDLINPLAKTRPILLINPAGVGHSGSEVGPTFADWAAQVVAIAGGLGIKQIDLLGFPMGGMAAQMVALNAPRLVRRLILADAGPSAGEGVEQGPAWAFEMLYAGSTAQEAEAAFLKTFYSVSEEKQALEKQWWARINGRQEDRAGYLGPEETAKQTSAVVSWMTSGNPGHSYERLGELKIPLFVAAGGGGYCCADCE